MTGCLLCDVTQAGLKLRDPFAVPFRHTFPLVSLPSHHGAWAEWGFHRFERFGAPERGLNQWVVVQVRTRGGVSFGAFAEGFKGFGCHVGVLDGVHSGRQYTLICVEDSDLVHYSADSLIDSED